MVEPEARTRAVVVMPGMKNWMALLGAAAVLGMQTGSARASLVFTSSGTNAATGNWLSAQASFDLINHGTELQITLSNVGGQVRSTSDVLTALFFDLGGGTTLTPLSAVLSPGSTLLNGPLSSGLSLGDNWEYLNNLSNLPGQPTQGIAAAGFGVFGHGNFGSQSQNLRGADFGIVNGPVTAGNGQLANLQLESNSLIFTLGGLPANFSLSAISDVEFQYGTSLSPSEPLLVAYAVPEPTAFALLALGGSALMMLRRPRS